MCILTADKFDANGIVVDTVSFGPSDVLAAHGGGTAVHGDGHIEDSIELDEVTRDDDMDLVFHFDASDSGIVEGTTEACVWGITDGGVYLEGCDAVRIPPGNTDAEPRTGSGKGKN